MKQAAESYQLAQAGAGGGGGAGPVFQDRLKQIIVRGPGPVGSKTLVIRSGDADPKTQANLEEDLAVMTRILDKSVEEKLGGQPSERTAMGINVAFAPVASPIRSLYLDGYGALFMLNVNFPLLAPPAKIETTKEEAPAGSAWEEAKREVYGSRADGKNAPAPAENYSEEKVSKLKDALLEALKDATNIRNLKPDDSITVCVFGGANVGSARGKAVVARTGGSSGNTVELGAEETRLFNRAVALSGPPSRGSTMTIRAKKSDVDAFAKGKLNADEFRKKAAITTYPGNANAGGGNSPFVRSSGGGGVFSTDSFTFTSDDGSIGAGAGYAPAP
jgi:hypothetical protein